MKMLWGFLPTLFLALNLWASPASYETQLMKLAKSLKGEPASLLERQALNAATAEGKADEFLAAKTREYLNDAKFTLKLKQKVDELIRLIPQSGPQSLSEFEISKKPTAYDSLVQNIISQNKPWDQLLTAKNYVANPIPTIFRDEKEFYANLTDEQNDPTKIYELFDPTYKSTPLSYDFASDDQRVAGIITTPRFFDRYVTTALNKNRRRAAAVFRIFMCDTMIPTVPKPDSSTEQKDYEKILPDHSHVSEEQIRQSTTANIHGQQPDCMACHYKLDPLGQTFALSASTLAPKPSPGALRFKGYDGRKVDIQLRGFGDLATAISQQPEYEKCQVSYFWRWYIGKDVPLTTEREQQIIQTFNQMQRKTKDFVAYLLQQPEFKERPLVLSADQLLAQRAVKIFKSCTSCHESTDEVVWDLATLPYSGDITRREKKINLIKKVLDIDGGGKNATMPPRDSLWQLSSDEFNTLKTWIARGGPDLQGVPQVGQVASSNTKESP